jgi:nucleotide-binding universal stress UspA family protein
MFAEKFRSELLLVHATVPPTFGATQDVVPPETFELEREIAETQMRSFIFAEPDLKNTKHRQIIRYGTALDLVQQVVTQEKADLVVVGSHGPDGLEKLAIGSTAEAIVRKVSCPVLVVGPNARINRKSIDKIVLATNVNMACLRAAQYAAALTQRFNAKLTMVHAIEAKRQRRDVQPELVESTMRADLRCLLPSDFLQTLESPEIYLEHGKPGDVINHVSRSAKADLIVTGVNEHTTLGDHSLSSTMSQVIREAFCPVMTVRHHLCG